MRRIATGMVCVFILGAAFVGPAAAETKRQRAAVAYRAGLAAMERRDFVRARAAFERALKLGAPWAGYNLGLMYTYGLGVKADPPRACDYYEVASRTRRPQPMHNLGNCYQYGRGRPKNYKLAKAWYRRAAAAGSNKSYCALGNMVRLGLGSPRNVERGIAMCRKAAIAGDADAAADIGTLYLRGMGVAVDFRRAAKWLSAAARKGQPNAQHLYASQLWNGHGVVKNRELAACWWSAATLRGQKYSAYHLGAYYYTKSFNYERKRLFDQPAAKAVMWLLIGARNDPRKAIRKESRFLARKLHDISPNLLARAKVEYQKTLKRIIPFGSLRGFTPANCP